MNNKLHTDACVSLRSSLSNSLFPCLSPKMREVLFPSLLGEGRARSERVPEGGRGWRFGGAVFSLLFSISLNAQVLTTPYFCGFEDAAENSNWILNYGSNGTNPSNKNRWHIGNATSNLEQNSLYISADGGATAGYDGSAQTAVVAHREILLPTGNYTLAFSWKAMGGANAKLHVCWMPATYPAETSLGGLPTWVNTYRLGSVTYNNSTSWSFTSLPLSSNGALSKLVFVWENGNDTEKMPAACIDNVQIGDMSCLPPSGFTNTGALGKTVSLSWGGTADNYDIQYSSYDNRSRIYSTTVSNINSISFSDLATISGGASGEAIYDFWIRSSCPNGKKSIWVPLNNVFVYDPSLHCIDIIDFNSSGVQGTIGTFDNAYSPSGIVDNGYASVNSRQAVHYMPEEFDERTDYRLPTTPKTSPFSVRLGNWNANTEAESLTYTFTATQDMGVILLHYAVVLESGGTTHTPYIQPRFEMKIRDVLTGQVINGDCGQANFTPPGDASESVPGDGWHQGIDNMDVWWREWTTVGVNIPQGYAGRPIKVELTTYDCAWGGHWGYAYFALSCGTATLESNSCGNSSTLSVTAPDGFDYEWYRQPGTILSTDKDFEVPALATDTGIYYVDVIYKEDTNCRFTLKTVLKPRIPFAQAGFFHNPHDCINEVLMLNTSGVEGGDGIATGEDVDSYLWKFSDGQTFREKSPKLIFPNTGGTLDATLVVGLNDNVCQDSINFTMIIPPIQSRDTTIQRSICKGTKYIFNGKEYTTEGLYPVPLKTKAGCDSLITLDLKVVDEIVVTVYDTICYRERYPNPNGGYFDKAGYYPIRTASSMGCDSITNLYLTVRNEIVFTPTVQNVSAGPGSGSIDLGLPSGYTYTINGVLNGNLTGLSAGKYTIVAYNESGCASDPQEIVIKTTCLSVSIRPVGTICGDETDFSVPFEIEEGSLTGYSVLFDEQAKNAGFEDIENNTLSNNDEYITVPLPVAVRPDEYNGRIIFYDVNCPGNDLELPFNFSVYYPSVVVQQKWNDVLAVLNERYNGGYLFSAFQWYRNGEPIQGKTGSYLYLGEGQIFNPADVYHVELTRMGENYSVISCPITPIIQTELAVYPTIVNSGGIVTVKTKANSKVNIRLWDTMGLARKTFSSSEETINITMPYAIGVYLMEISTESGERKTIHIIVK